MNPTAFARTAYASAAAPIRTERDSEYAVFARVTSALKSLDETDRRAFPQLAEAVSDNSRLWAALGEDLMGDGNRLPDALRAQLIGLAEFVRRHGMLVLAGKGSVVPLIDINTSIMRGLRGNAEAAA